VPRLAQFSAIGEPPFHGAAFAPCTETVHQTPLRRQQRSQQHLGPSHQAEFLSDQPVLRLPVYPRLNAGTGARPGPAAAAAHGFKHRLNERIVKNSGAPRNFHPRPHDRDLPFKLIVGQVHSGAGDRLQRAFQPQAAHFRLQVPVAAPGQPKHRMVGVGRIVEDSAPHQLQEVYFATLQIRANGAPGVGDPGRMCVAPHPDCHTSVIVSFPQHNSPGAQLRESPSYLSTSRITRFSDTPTGRRAPYRREYPCKAACHRRRR